MIHAPLDTTIAPSARDWRSRPRYIESHRALAACEREIRFVAAEIARRLQASEKAGALTDLAVVSSPGRCMVQLGPVALTLAWLRTRLDIVADGELLIIVWEGEVGRGTRRVMERAHLARAASARSVWEDTLTAVADDPESWRWRSAVADVSDSTSLLLADRCVDQLLRAHSAQALHALHALHDVEGATLA